MRTLATSVSYDDSPTLEDRRKRAQIVAFHGSTFLSSLGSMTFATCLIAFLIKENYPFYVVGLTLALSRIAPLIVGLGWGQLADRSNPNRFVVVCEIAAAILAAGLALTWWAGPSVYWIFLTILCTRSCSVCLQDSARSKIAKILSDDSYASNASNAIALNVAIHGPLLFAGVISWFLVRDVSFEQVILFDALTFAASGVIFIYFGIGSAGSVSAPDTGRALAYRGANPFSKFQTLYKFSATPAALDLMLAISMCGTGALIARLADGRESLVPLFITSYGAAVWLAGYLERLPFVVRQHASLWFTLGISMAAAFAASSYPFFALGFCFLKDLSYWILFHRYSSEIQNQTPSSFMASAAAARSVQMTLVLALGELGVGFWKNYLPNLAEGLWRGVLCLGVGIIIIWYRGVRREPATC